MLARPLLASLLVLLAAGAAAHNPPINAEHEATSEAMRQAAIAWLETLDEPLRERAVFPFDAPLRTDWHFIPKPRQGVAMGEMDLPQRRAARVLLRTALSDRGYLKVTTIMSLERVLRVLEADRPGVEAIRDPQKYWFAVFGDPAANNDRPWGWRIEGHHVSLNFTSTPHGERARWSTTPLFLGANPAEVRVGPRLGLRALGAEDDLGRALMASLDERRRRKATIASVAPDDVAGVPGAPPRVDGPAGLPHGEMTADQQSRLWELIRAFAHVLRPALAHGLLEEIDAAGRDGLHFAWAGSLASLADPATDERHYFRVHGPTFVLELDFQEPNHVHAVWHSTTDDFGQETLRRHYATHPHGR